MVVGEILGFTVNGHEYTRMIFILRGVSEIRSFL